jgi:hypothetical protein
MNTFMIIRRKFIKYLIISLLCFCLGFTVNLGLPSALFAQDATITDFTVSNSDSQVLLYLTVKDCFTEDMESAIHNGIPATFTFYVDVYKLRSKWPNKKIQKYEFNHVMEYDSLKKEYKVHRGEMGDTKMTTSLDAAKVIMSEVNGFNLLLLEEIDPDSSYVVRVKAKLARKTLPLYFHYLIPFTSLWDFETDWHELKLQLSL